VLLTKKIPLPHNNDCEGLNYDMRLPRSKNSKIGTTSDQIGQAETNMNLRITKQLLLHEKFLVKKSQRFTGMRITLKISRKPLLLYFQLK